MHLDIPTLIYVSGLISLAACIGFSLLLLVLRDLPVLRTWVASMWVATSGIVLIGLRGSIPDSLSIIVANGAIAFSNVLMLKGIAAHVGYAFRWRTPLLVVALYTVLIAWFAYVDRDLRIRIVLASLLSVGWDVWNITLLLRYGQREIRISCRLTAAVLGIDATYFAIRALIPLAPHAGQDFMKAGAPVVSTYVAGVLISVAIYFALLLLITERLMVDLRRLARTDALTGLLNRGAIIADGTQALVRCQKHHKPFALLIFDLDHFKQVNDRWGHEAGDAVLRHFTAILQQGASRQSSSLASRYGGEEFLLALPDAGLAEAMSLAEQLRQVLADAPIMFGDHPIAMTTSIGVAIAQAGATFEHLIAQADEALYRAKSEGRNSVIHAPAQAGWQVA